MQELNELKNLVIQSLESNGALSNIRAQIRASVFKVIDSQDSGSSKKGSPFYWENPKCQKLSEDPNGLLMLQLIKEFLQFYKMDYSLSVYSSESNVRQQVKREKLNANLDLPDDDEKPLLYLLLQEYQNGGGAGGKGGLKPLGGGGKPDVGAPAQKETPQAAAPAPPAAVPGQPAVNNLVGKNDPPKKAEVPSKNAPPPAFDPLDSSTEEKKTLQEAQDIIKKNQNNNNLKVGGAPAPPAGKDAPGAQGGSAPAANKYSNMKEVSYDQSGDYDNEEFDEDINDEDDLEDQEIQEPGSRQPQHVNPLASSEDFMAASQSQGFDMSVDSMALEGYDYFEEVDKP